MKAQAERDALSLRLSRMQQEVVEAHEHAGEALEVRAKGQAGGAPGLQQPLTPPTPRTTFRRAGRFRGLST